VSACVCACIVQLVSVPQTVCICPSFRCSGWHPAPRDVELFNVYGAFRFTEHRCNTVMCCVLFPVQTVPATVAFSQAAECFRQTQVLWTRESRRVYTWVVSTEMQQIEGKTCGPDRRVPSNVNSRIAPFCKYSRWCERGHPRPTYASSAKRKLKLKIFSNVRDVILLAKTQIS
jgi:hypothetical protein